MRAFLAAISLLLCCGCQQRQAKMSEEDIKRIVAGLPGITDACIDKLRYGGIQAMPNETDQCFEMMPQRRWTGLWLRVFEGSQFCPDEQGQQARTCEFSDNKPNIWFEPGKGDLAPGYGLGEGLYRVDFVGRRTAKPGGHGHLGQFAHEVIVDRMISVKQVNEY